MGFWEEDHKGKVAFLSYHSKGTYYQHDLSLFMLIAWWDGVCKVILFSPFHMVLFWRKLLGGAHTRWGVMLHILKGTVSTWIIWNFSAWEVCLSATICSYFNYLFTFILAWTHEYLFYTLAYLILLYLFYCSFGSSVFWMVVCIYVCEHFPSGTASCSRFILYTSTPVLGTSLFVRSHCPFYWRVELETKIWVLALLIATTVLLLQGPFGWQSKEINVCILTYIYTHNYKYFYM